MRNRWNRCLQLHTLFIAKITRSDEIKATPHDGAAAHLINDLCIHFLLELYPKMLKHPGEQEPVAKIMGSGGVCNANYVGDREGRKVDLLSSIHKISEALVVHCISLISPLPSRDDVLNNESKYELVERLHITLLHSLGVFQPWLLTQPLSQLQQFCLAQQGLGLLNI